MKPKNLICYTLLGLTICGSAFAASVEDRKAFCDKYPDKYVWVRKTEECIPINPCLSSNESIKNLYCNIVFQNVYPSDYEGQEKDLVNLFAASRDMDCFAQDIVDGENIVICKGDDVLVFEFPSIYKQNKTIDELNTSDIRSVIYKMCTNVFNGKMAKDLENPKKFECKEANYEWCENASLKTWRRYNFDSKIVFSGNKVPAWCNFKIKD